MHEKAIKLGLMREETRVETPLERHRRLSLARVAADTIINTQVKVDEASLRHRNANVMEELLRRVAEADRDQG